MSRPQPGREVPTTTYRVEGMSCAHCVAAVTEEIELLAGVEHVTVDLVAGSAQVVGDVPADLVVEAVAAAGYVAVAAP